MNGFPIEFRIDIGGAGSWVTETARNHSKTKNALILKDFAATKKSLLNDFNNKNRASREFHKKFLQTPSKSF